MTENHLEMSYPTMDLLKKANPVLFSEERYDEYPLDGEELMQYLSTSSTINNHSRPLTNVDYSDYLVYGKDDGSNHQEIDLDKKLISEFILFLIQSRQHDSNDAENNKHKSIKFEEFLKMEPYSKRWYNCILDVLEQGNATEVVDLSMSNKILSEFIRKGNERDLVKADDQTLEELTSYLLSSAIKRGIDIKPVRLDDPVAFLKNGIDCILNSVDSSSLAPSQELDHNDDSENKPSSQENEIGKNKDIEQSMALGERESETTMEEMKTAFKDLQLAHNFLTKRFEHDRVGYSQDIEKLTRTNRELQEKLLSYHSSLTKTEKKLQEAEKASKELKTKNDNYSSPRTLSNTSNPLNSPILSPELWGPPSPGSINSNAGAHSISIMRNEFKRIITETQKKHEKELSEERKKRLDLEEELKKLKE
ncbi:hypothetical protein NCAS_0A03860 [Naumovozyma castellii]|uniref:Uncharacterized protein n=1 Tax=Naumovozyma castellii TaxID=27288 RepID=G0V653_NAUCA|nr:hypothetical protein NCAS_0A03860 [Naumovozyma castellii CBS 4309]CCC66944.1 hypothetical protein NCAS_0A03860 [Naumovozyma castellii CBS 4309]